MRSVLKVELALTGYETTCPYACSDMKSCKRAIVQLHWIPIYLVLPAYLDLCAIVHEEVGDRFGFGLGEGCRSRIEFIAWRLRAAPLAPVIKPVAIQVDAMADLLAGSFLLQPRYGRVEQPARGLGHVL